MRVQLDGDLVIGEVFGDMPGVDVPESYSDLPLDRLRWNGSSVIDIAGRNAFYIDEYGTKHVLRINPGWPQLTVNWDGEVRRDGDSWIAIPADETKKAALKAYAAKRRWAKETSGIVFASLPVPTDERTQNVLAGAYSRARADAGYSIPKWKVGPSEYVTLSNAEIIAIGEAVADRVQALFSKNAEVDDMIDSDEITTTTQIDALFDAG